MRCALRTVRICLIANEAHRRTRTSAERERVSKITPVLLEYLRCICEVYLRCIVFEAEESRKNYIDSISKFRFVRARKGNKSLGKLASPLGVLWIRGHEFGI